MTRNLIQLGVLSVCLGAIFGCGGGGGDAPSPAPSISNPPPMATVESGLFLDSAVEGLAYTSGAQSGLTGPDGAFRYQAGVPVEFSIGGIILGSAAGAPILTPVDLVAGAENEGHRRVTNLARFLQTLDDDNDPDNGILITQAIRNAALNRSVDFDLDPGLFASDENVNRVISDLTTLTAAGTRPMVDAGSAQNHLAATRVGLGCAAAPCLEITSYWSDQFPGVRANYLPGGSGTETRYILAADRGEQTFEFHAKTHVVLVPSDAGQASQLRVSLATETAQGAWQTVGESSMDDVGNNTWTFALRVSHLLDLGLEPNDYQVIAWLDENANDAPDSGEILTASTAPFRVVTGVVYTANVTAANLGRILNDLTGLAVADVPIASEFIRNFLATDAIRLGGRSYPSAPLPFASIGQQLTHNVGIAFENPTGTIRNFALPADSTVANAIADSVALFDAVADTMASDSNVNELLAADLQNDQPAQRFEWPIMKARSGTLLAFDGSFDRDLFWAFGEGANLDAVLEVDVQCVANIFAIRRLNVRGHLVDVYDFDYEKDPELDRRMAMIQAGFGTLGDAGGVFRVDVTLDNPIDPALFGFGNCGVIPDPDPDPDPGPNPGSGSLEVIAFNDPTQGDLFEIRWSFPAGFEYALWLYIGGPDQWQHVFGTSEESSGNAPALAFNRVGSSFCFRMTAARDSASLWPPDGPIVHNDYSGNKPPCSGL